MASIRTRTIMMPAIKRVVIAHVIVLSAIVMWPLMKGLFKPKPPTQIPIRFEVMAPSGPDLPEQPVNEKPEPRDAPPPPEKPKPEDVVIPEKPKKPDPPKPVEKPKPEPEKPKWKPTPVDPTKARRVKIDKPAPGPNPLSEEEIARRLKEGAVLGTTNTTPAKDDDRFTAIIYNKLKSAWIQPDRQNTGSLTTAVTIGLGPGGRITSRRLAKSSGNKTMDDSVMAAAESIRSIPQLSADFIRRNPSITIEFRHDAL